jgi:5'-3' exonuclease
MLALIDGDIIAYRAAAMSETEDQAAENVAQLLEGWTSGAGCDERIVALSSRPSFRYRLYDQYKAHRKDKPKPPHLGFCMELLTQQPYLKLPDTEGDDVIGIASTRGVIGPHVIVTNDKDMLQIPGNHWNPVLGTMTHINEDMADLKFHMQWLTGDATDHIPGIPGVGPAKAEKILADVPPERRTLTVLSAYRERKLDPDYALLMGRLVRILTKDQWDESTQTISMWSYL